MEIKTIRMHGKNIELLDRYEGIGRALLEQSLPQKELAETKSALDFLSTQRHFEKEHYRTELYLMFRCAEDAQNKDHLTEEDEAFMRTLFGRLKHTEENEKEAFSVIPINETKIKFRNEDKTLTEMVEQKIDALETLRQKYFKDQEIEGKK